MAKNTHSLAIFCLNDKFLEKAGHIPTQRPRTRVRAKFRCDWRTCIAKMAKRQNINFSKNSRFFHQKSVSSTLCAQLFWIFFCMGMFAWTRRTRRQEKKRDLAVGFAGYRRKTAKICDFDLYFPTTNQSLTTRRPTFLNFFLHRRVQLDQVHP